MPKFRLSSHSLIILVAALVTVAQARAEDQSYTATVGGAAYSPTVLIYFADGHPYVPLFELARELGGSARIATPTEAEVTIGDKRAVLALNGVRYDVGGTPQDLARPFLPYESEVLAAKDEVQAFFQNAFGISLTELSGTDAAPAPVEETPPAMEPVVLDESAELLETDAIAPVEEAAAEPASDSPASAYQAIVIDAGHGGNDAGAQGPGGTMEKDVCLAIAKRVAELLAEDKRIKVFLVRNEDQTLSIPERAKLAVQQENAFLLSIHTGASFAPGSSGVEVFYPADYSRSRVAGSRERAAAETLVQALTAESATQSRGIRRAPLRLFAESELPGCLVEVGCISNPEEEQQLANAAYQDRIARGLARGLQQLTGGA